MEKSKQIWVGGICYNQYPDCSITIPQSFFNKPVACTSEHINELNELNNMNTSLNSQAQFMSAVKYHNYIVGSVSVIGTLSFASSPTVHTSHQAARAECLRLSQLTPGKMYIFTRLEGGELIPVATAQSF